MNRRRNGRCGAGGLDCILSGNLNGGRKQHRQDEDSEGSHGCSFGWRADFTCAPGLNGSREEDSSAALPKSGKERRRNNANFVKQLLSEVDALDAWECSRLPQLFFDAQQLVVLR